jgi:hypothetical protein
MKAYRCPLEGKNPTTAMNYMQRSPTSNIADNHCAVHAATGQENPIFTESNAVNRVCMAGMHPFFEILERHYSEVPNLLDVVMGMVTLS